MKKVRRKSLTPWTFYFLTYYVCLTATTGLNCPHPEVPYAATYLNITGGADSTIRK